MREETKARLDALMASYESRRAEHRGRQSAARLRQDAFVAEFEQTTKDVIRPVMEDIGTSLRQRGHEYKITTTQGHHDSNGRYRETQITMRIFPGEIPRSLFTTTSTPLVAFASDRHQMRISVYGCTSSPIKGGWYGQRASFAAKQLTPNLVEREILEVLAGTFGG